MNKKMIRFCRALLTVTELMVANLDKFHGSEIEKFPLLSWSFRQDFMYAK